ncbi:MAG: hypothetical protein KU29_02455 [Sulfurovum sp. FS06-10]|nr:MAG: hypothetical protein KU29_02455 [Sulfurovum sp. FS06-10]
MNHNEIEEDEIDIGKIIVHLKRNLKIIVFITFLITLATGIYAYFLKPIYSSSASIAFSDQQMSKLASIIPDELSEFSNKESELKTVKLTIETRKFINSVIEDLDIHQRYLLEKNFKKNEVYGFDNLKISLDIHNEILYGELFEIQPIDDTHFLLKVDALDYSKTHLYNEEIKENFFALNVLKTGAIEEQSYFITSHDKTLLADEILENMTVTILSDNVLSVTYNDTVAERAKELVEEIAQSFIAYTLDKKTAELSQTLGFLDIFGYNTPRLLLDLCNVC